MLCHTVNEVSSRLQRKPSASGIWTQVVQSMVDKHLHQPRHSSGKLAQLRSDHPKEDAGNSASSSTIILISLRQDGRGGRISPFFSFGGWVI